MSEIKIKHNYQNFKPKKNFVERLPFYKRYQRGLILGGSVLTFCIVYSAPIYYFFRTPPEYVDPRTRLWPGEIAAGKTYSEQFKERFERRKIQTAEYDAKVAAAAAPVKQ